MTVRESVYLSAVQGRRHFREAYRRERRRYITMDALREILRRDVERKGSQAQWAELHGVSAQYVCDCLKGRRDIGESIARVFGMKPMTVYVSVNANPSEES